jgi:hypothetical protein
MAPSRPPKPVFRGHDAPTAPIPRDPDSGGSYISGSDSSDHGALEGPAIGRGQRYEAGGLLGRGGMGEVRIARDTWLGRDVAIKRPRAHDADASRRLAREATLTAELEHPNIVPVYEAGRDENGEPFYTMRLLPGRSLSDVLVGTTGEARIRLVRHVLGAAEAIVYAHERGILHRDLKPSNIMVGALGETVVADWGLACRTSEHLPAPAGTVGYMSPEQALGEPVDGRTDVYGLGAILYCLLVGRAPPPAPAPPVRSMVPDAPAELAAIADRALQRDRERRYTSARAMADDLLAWFEGRQVAAHTYSPSELARRVFMAYRLPFGMATAAVLMVISAVAWGWWRSAAEEQRAQASEAEALAARASERHALAGALVAQAKSAADTNRRMEAEIFAVNALVREETPEARGLVARLSGPRLTLLRAVDLPTCRQRDVTDDGARMVCAEDQRVRLFDPMAPDVILGEVQGQFLHLAFITHTDVLLNDADSKVWVWSPPAAPKLLDTVPVKDMRAGTSRFAGRVALAAQGADIVIDARTHEVLRGHACGTGPATPTAIAANGDLFAGCPDNRIVRGPAGTEGPTPTLTVVNPAYGVVNRIVELADGRLVIGTFDGVAVLLSPAGEELEHIQVGAEAIRQILPFGDRLAIRAIDGNTVIWSPDTPRALLRMNASAHLAWPGEPGVLRMVDARSEDRAVPDQPPVHRIEIGAGLTAVAWSPDGGMVASSAGDGRVVVSGIQTGATLATYKWADGVVKDVAWSPKGDRLVGATTSLDQRYLEFPSGRMTPFSDVGFRRVAWLPSENLIGAAYKGQVYIYGPDAYLDDRFGLPEMRVIGSVGVALGDDAVYRITDGHPPTFRKIGHYAGVHCVTPLGDETVVATTTELMWLDAQGTVTRRIEVADTNDITASPDGRWLALGHLDGSVTLWPSHADAPIARMIAHTARIAGVAFSPDGTSLATASWDGDVRIWSMTELEAPAEVLRERAEREWGRSLEELLSQDGWARRIY